jgi:hypothetical protein
MKPPIILPSNNIRDDPTYIVIKIPRDSLQSSDIDSLISDIVGDKLKRRVGLALCIISLMLGIFLGSMVHPSLFHKTPETAVWKSSNFMQSDGK